MYRIMLVDDEEQIIEGLTVIINWQKHACTVVGSAYNGKNGIARALELRPDIIVTDLRMPQMDGLEMIGRIREELPHVKFIILSGYSEFEYAKKGMMLGVKHYVLKPVEEKELENSLAMIVQELAEEKEKREELEQYKKLGASSIGLQRLLILRDMLSAGMDNEELMEALEATGIELKHPYITCLSARISSTAGIVEKQPVTVRESNDATIISFQYAPTEIAVLMNHAWKSGMRHHESILRVQASLSESFHDTVSIGAGSISESVRLISRSFQQARMAASDYMSVDGGEQIIYYEQFRSRHAEYMLPEDWSAGIEAAMEQLQPEIIDAAVQKLLETLQATGGLNQLDLRMQCLNVYAAIASKLTPRQLQQLTLLAGEDILSLEPRNAIWTFEQCKSWVHKLFDSIVHLRLQHQSESGSRHIVDEVKDYIDNHYGDNLTLFSVAEKFYISPNYLSELFRKQTKITFLAYLTHVRIERAKQLLLNREAKLYEVCAQVGYENPKYFRKVFQKLTGWNPSDYRKSHSLGP
ncbi:response regulator transcription factor [Paenibacillus sp. J5C_2022]|uniref:response regulator transcription factor n=1 Tax=Paenibacillus sp. J5C2022 TaxID=2977129 RepID=UPI0021D306B6|nr:response regulator transcription factor [Paenibacillus sp. J5C2022]MCU6712117.1 response regulator transcription factor [Paenibacillus sp. J5C2022]